MITLNTVAKEIVRASLQRSENPRTYHFLAEVFPFLEEENTEGWIEEFGGGWDYPNDRGNACE